MARTALAPKPFKPKTVLISGSTFKHAKLGSLKFIKHSGQVKRGLGVQYRYTFTSAQQLSQFFDHLADKAIDLADEHGASSNIVVDMYNQMDHL